MLRFIGERRAWAMAAVVALVLAIGLWVWGLPFATARASERIGDRFGVLLKIDDTRPVLGGVTLRGVEVSGREGGFRVRVDEVKARVRLITALFDPAGSVRSLAVQGVEVSVDLSDPGFEDSLEAVRSKLNPTRSSSAPATSKARPRTGRSYQVAGVNVHVLDADGPLLELQNASLGKSGGELHAASAEIMVGESRADHAQLGPFQISLQRNEGGWVLRKLSIDGAKVRSLRNGEGEHRALASRVQDLLEILRPPEEPSAEPAAEEADEIAEPEEVPDREPRPVQIPNADSTRLFARLAPDTDISVSGADIESRTPAGHVERIRDFQFILQGGDNGWFRLRVGGETSNKGALSVDLSVMPADARAEGSVRLRGISLALLAPFVPGLPLYQPEVGTVSAELELEASSTDSVGIEGSLRLRELALADERIAIEPVEHVNLDVGGRGVWHPAERRLLIERGTVRMGKARVLIEGELERTSEHYRIDLTAKLPPTACNDVVGAIPEDVLGSLSRFDWSGNWSALTRIELDSRDLEATELSIRVRNLCLFERAPRWVRVERFTEPFTHRAVEPDETLFEMRTGPGTENWVAFADISQFVPASVISHEDGGFYEHAGFAPWAIRDALVRNLQEGRYVVGASTISMQLAKNLYLQREKTLSRKAQEVLLTWWLENALNKDEILELYLNVIEYGPSVYGLRPAAAYYFGREPSELSPAEAAFLACILPSPKRYHVSYERGELTRSMKNRMRRLLEHTAKRERIGPEALAFGLAELETFQFHREGDPPPAPRLLPPLGAPDEPDPTGLDPFEALFVSP